MSRVLKTAAVLVTGVGVMLTSGLFRMGDRTGDIPLFETPAWQGTAQAYGEGLLLRRTALRGGALLLRHSLHDTVYRYEPSGLSLSPAAPEEWQRAEGPVAECSRQHYPHPSVLRVDESTDTLWAGSRQVETAGPTALKITASPGGQRAAVLSASGRKARSILPFGGGSGASGQYFHQVMSLPDAAPCGPAVALPTRRDYDSLIACWSADEQYVVYFQVTFDYLSIVTTQCPQPQPGAER